MDLSWYIHRIKVKGDSAYCINSAQVLKQVYLIEQHTHIVALAEPHAQETRTTLMPWVSSITLRTVIHTQWADLTYPG